MRVVFWGATLMLFAGIALAFHSTMGAGGFKRLITITGIYSVCKPDGYDVVCFLDADGKEGGMFCMPLSSVGGVCKK